MQNLELYLPESINEYWERKYKIKQTKLSPIFEIVHNGTILPIRKEQLETYLFGIAGVIDDDGKYVDISAHFTYQGQGKNRYGTGYQPDIVEYVDEDVIFFGGFWKQWGHYILEQISRLWYAVQLENQEKISINELKFAYFSNNGDTIDWKGDDFSELLLILGINPNNFYQITRPTKFRNVIVPEQSMIFGKGFSKEYSDIINKLFLNVEKKLTIQSVTCPLKIYFSRTQFKVAAYRELGENRLQKVFKDNGFEILYPETMGLDKKIFYINHAEVIASLAGSAAHQTIFRVFNPKSLLQIILIKDKEIDSQSSELQIEINKQVGNKVCAVFACQNVYQAIGSIGPFLIKKTKYFRRFCKDHNMLIKRDSIKDFINCAKDIFIFVGISLYRKLKKQYDPKKR